MQFSFSSTLSAQPGTVTFVTSSSCVPGECGDSSTDFDLVIGDITLERQSIQNTTLKYAGRFPNFQTAPLNNVPLSVVTQYQTFGLPTFLSYNLFPPTTITSVTPSVGQGGTNVTITAGDILLDLDTLSRVRLGDTDADIISGGSSQAVIQVQARSGSAGNGDVLINTTQVFEGVSYDGPYTQLQDGWTQLRDGNITDIIPLAAQLGRDVLLCGNSLLGNGTSIAAVRHGANVLLEQQRSPSAPPSNLPATECLAVQVPSAVRDPTTEASTITITSDTGAVVTSVSNFSISMVASLTPSRGQAGTVVTIRGRALLSGYTTVPSVFLSDILAEVLQWDNSEVVVRAGTPIPQVPVIGVNGSISIEVTNPFDGLSRFNVSDDSVWQYEDLGVVDMVTPGFGQYGTRVTVTGTNLLAYGSGLTHATIGGVNATIIDGASDSVVELVVPDADRTDIVDVTLFSDTGANVRGSRIFQYMEKGVVLSASPSQGQRGTFGECIL